MIKISSALEPGQVVMLGCHMGTSQLPGQDMGYEGEDKLPALSPEHWSISLAVVGHIRASYSPLICTLPSPHGLEAEHPSSP